MNPIDRIEQLQADLARVTAERDDALYREQMLRSSERNLLEIEAFKDAQLVAAQNELSALRARVAELEATIAELTTDGNAATLAANLAKASKRNAELVAALRPIYALRKNCEGDIGWRGQKDAKVGWVTVRDILALEQALDRAESSTPAKHPDTERGVKHARKLNGLAAWLEHEADVRKACATNEGDRWDAMRMSECAEAIREYAARKQGGEK